MGQMGEKKSRPSAGPSGRAGTDVDSSPQGEADRAFDLWLRRGLHKIYDTVAEQPVPDEILRMIEEDRKAKAPRK